MPPKPCPARPILPCAIALALTLVAGLPAGAETVLPGPVTRLASALLLQREAEARDDALGLMMAAQLAQSVERRAASSWSRESRAVKAAGTPTPAAPQPASLSLDWLVSDEAWLTARLRPAEDGVLAEVLLGLAPPDPRLRRASVSEARAELAKGHEDQWSLVLPGQSPAELLVLSEHVGPDAAALLWSVRTPEGDEVCAPRPSSSLRPCRFTPAANGFHSVIIRGPSTAETAHPYRLLSN